MSNASAIHAAIHAAIKEFRFKELFIEELGWNHLRESHTVVVDNVQYSLNGVAEKRSFKVFLCSPNSDGSIPERQIRVKIDRKATTFAPEHLLIFVDAQQQTQRWQWIKREGARPAGIREAIFVAGKKNQYLVETLQKLEITIQEEEETTLFGVTQKVSKAFDVEKVTKKFYDLFKKEHDTLLGFLKGIPDENLARWYVSVILNRLMFIYFIQKKNFLNNNSNYLKSLLAASMANGKDQFYSHYLCRLFFDGFAKKDHSPDFKTTFGSIPYLNGGIFQKHQIEQLHEQTIHIPDRAFEQLFEFFDRYQWRLDERPLRNDNEINPDVLGYIFEKYINQKQMGAYYTKEDITGYICRNTIIPRLFDMAREDCAVAFQGEQSVWRLLRDDPDRYIYGAVTKGTEHPLPNAIAAGIDDVTKRDGWNTLAPEEFALPTEIWREVVARRQRYQETRTKLASGEVRQIADVITLNLNIERFALDAIETSEGPELIRAFWRAIVGRIPERPNQTFQPGISILDPTCGSGAFLFAALNILEPMYEACLNRMEALIAEDDAHTRQNNAARRYTDFRKILEAVVEHPNRRYFIYKSIIINNLFGVDIMEEATEICKLRLFLKLAAQVDDPNRMEPLPDIDFNIRAGNALVGFATRDEVRNAINAGQHQQLKAVFDTDKETLARIEQKADDIDHLFLQFRQQQTTHGGDVSQDDKQELTSRMAALAAELNGYLARQYGLTEKTPKKKHQQWLQTHQPFHWFVEFYGILSRGGFDVVVGNPPYVEYKNIRNFYKILNYTTMECGDLFAYIMERAINLQTLNSYLGMIVPISIVSTDGFEILRKLLWEYDDFFFSLNYAERPSKLFNGVEKRLTIWLHRKNQYNKNKSGYTAKYRRWFSEEREFLFNQIQVVQYKYLKSLVNAAIPKISLSIDVSILDKINLQKRLDSQWAHKSSFVVYYTRKLRYFVQFFDFIPKIKNAQNENIAPSELKEIYMNSDNHKDILIATLNSSLFYLFFSIYSDVRNVNRREIDAFRCSVDSLDFSKQQILIHLKKQLMADLIKNAKWLTGNYGVSGILSIQSFQPRLSKPIIDQIDKVLAEHYGFTDEELDYIINYDIKYRMGIDGGEE